MAPALTQATRDELRELLAKATQGPWSSSDDDASPELGDVVIWGPSENWLLNIGNWARQRDSASEIDGKSAARQYCELRDASDAALIVALRNNATALLDAADRCAKLEAALLALRVEHHPITHCGKRTAQPGLRDLVCSCGADERLAIIDAALKETH